MEAKQNSLRALLFPWLAHGHVFPFLELAKRLSNKSFHTYLCSTAINLDSVKKKLSDDDDDLSLELVELQLPSLPELPPQYHTTKNIPPHLFPTLIKAFEMSKSNFYDVIRNLTPDLLIYDVFQPWSAEFATSQGIPAVYFSTSGATTPTFLCHRFTHKNHETFPYSAISLREYEKKLLIDEAGFMEVIASRALKQSCDIALLKSCRAVEGKYMDYLSTLCKRKVIPTGPLIITDKEEAAADPEITNWLSQKSQFSTLYISFGSENYLSKEQTEEIAKGLLLSDVNFIWVVRTPSGSNIVIEDALPEGFLDRIKDRGLLVQGWAPQAAILAHTSVGGFMSHCGWSSVTESMYFAVPVVAVPFKLDQSLNCRLVVEAGVGVEVNRDENGQFNGEGMAKAINEVIVQESGKGLRCKAKELSKKMKMEEIEAFNEVAEELSRICAKKSEATTR